MHGIVARRKDRDFFAIRLGARWFVLLELRRILIPDLRLEFSAALPGIRWRVCRDLLLRSGSHRRDGSVARIREPTRYWAQLGARLGIEGDHAIAGRARARGRKEDRPWGGFPFRECSLCSNFA